MCWGALSGPRLDRGILFISVRSWNMSVCVCVCVLACVFVGVEPFTVIKCRFGVASETHRANGGNRETCHTTSAVHIVQGGTEPWSAKGLGAALT